MAYTPFPLALGAHCSPWRWGRGTNIYQIICVFEFNSSIIKTSYHRHGAVFPQQDVSEMATVQSLRLSAELRQMLRRHATD